MWGRWAPQNERTIIVGVPTAAAIFGISISNIATSAICENLGWPYAFYIYGAFGIFFGTVWIRVVNHPNPIEVGWFWNHPKFFWGWVGWFENHLKFFGMGWGGLKTTPNFFGVGWFDNHLKFFGVGWGGLKTTPNFFSNCRKMVGWFTTLVWIIYFRNTPDEMAWCLKEEKEYIKANTTASARTNIKEIPFRKILTSFVFWVACLSNIANSVIFFSITDKLPEYLQERINIF